MDSNTNIWNKVNLSIDQVSQLTGVKKTTLRYWEKEFSGYLKPERTETQRRQYTMAEVEKVGVLKQLIEEEKYKSAGVRLKLGLDQPRSVTQPAEVATTPPVTTATAQVTAGFSSLATGIPLTMAALSPQADKFDGGS